MPLFTGIRTSGYLHPVESVMFLLSSYFRETCHVRLRRDLLIQPPPHPPHTSPFFSPLWVASSCTVGTEPGLVDQSHSDSGVPPAVKKVSLQLCIGAILVGY